MGRGKRMPPPPPILGKGVAHKDRRYQQEVEQAAKQIEEGWPEWQLEKVRRIDQRRLIKAIVDNPNTQQEDTDA